ncbi:MAG: DoxX family protein [Burkholderiaceae bacterium]|nr:MAG: DoxX family protein [Burkholderiaceae bacterium]TAM05407.1 MAG: DoxX family protein [Pusillimonas sp.]
MNDSYKAYVALLGRVLLALMFIQSGFDKWLNISGTAAYIASTGLPLPSVLAVLAAALELFGGIALVLGVQVRWVGLAMALFTVVVGSIFHAYWAVPADQAAVMQLLFMKNISVAGGLLLISALGAGPLSVGGRRKALQ